MPGVCSPQVLGKPPRRAGGVIHVRADSRFVEQNTELKGEMGNHSCSAGINISCLGSGGTECSDGQVETEHCEQPSGRPP